jgi:predicted nucleic acid-binding Zn ribbon protein
VNFPAASASAPPNCSRNFRFDFARLLIINGGGSFYVDDSNQSNATRACRHESADHLRAAHAANPLFTDGAGHNQDH